MANKHVGTCQECGHEIYIGSESGQEIGHGATCSANPNNQ